MQTIKFQNAKAEHPTYLEPNRDYMQKTIEGLPVLKLFTPKKPTRARARTHRKTPHAKTERLLLAKVQSIYK